AVRHSGGAHAGDRLGFGRGHRRDRRHHGGAGVVSRSQHDGRRAALRLHRRAARRHHQPGGRCRRRADRRRHRESGRHLFDRQPAQAHGRAGADHPGAGVQAERLVRHRDRAAGVTMTKGLAVVLPEDASAARYGGLAAGAWRWIGALALIALAAALPFAVNNYHAFELTLVMIYAIAVLGLNILTGYNGQISLGHGGFFAAGAYTAAILMHRYGVPYWATLPPAALIGFALGVLFGLPALRFEGPYLALVTLAMALATPQLLKYFDTWTGGQQGINLVKPVPPSSLGLDRDRWLYMVALVVLLIAIRVAANMLNGRTGRAWVAIRAHPIAAAAMGIDTARYKTLAFGTSTLFTGVAGALSAIVIGYV